MVTSLQEIFDDLAASGGWMSEQNQESVSGPGSTMEYTRHFREGLERVLSVLKCQSFLDAPCGDYNWMQAVTMPPGLRYFGGDIVQQLVDQNRARHSASNRLFFKIDIVNEPLPAADLWLCRDCLFHLTFEQAIVALSNGVEAKIKYFMLTSHFNEVNEDGEIGGFREVNLCLPPFNLPEPQFSISDYVDGWPARRVGLWTREQVMFAIMAHPKVMSG